MKKNPQLEGKPRTVGFWMDVDVGLKLELETYAGCLRYAREAGWRLVLDPSIKGLHNWGEERADYDGLLMRAGQELADEASRKGVPLVNLWLNSPVEEIASVLPDFEAAGAMAAEHLLGRGLRNFGYLGARRPRDSELLWQGFRDAVGRAGFTCRSYRYPQSVAKGEAPGWEKFEAGLARWIDKWRPPKGILVHQDVFCRFLINACTAKGLSVPGDVAVVGCSDDTIICESSSPTLTSIDIGYERRGYQAAALLDRMMAGEAVPAERVRVAPARLIPRESSDVFAASDPLVARALRFMVDRSDRMLEVGEVVAAVGVSRRSLERKFRASVGRSIAEEMIWLRINRAQRRLAEGEVLLKTVATEAGFSTASHFSRVFTSVVGMPPSQYREERQKHLKKRRKSTGPEPGKLGGSELGDPLPGAQGTETPMR